MRIRLAHEECRRPEPYRIIISSDPHRPARTLVIPRRAPLVVLGATLVLALLALGFGFVSFQLSAGLHTVQHRLAAMARAAEDVARFPRSRGAEAASQAPAAALRLPSGAPATLVLESVNTGEILEVELDPIRGEIRPESYRRLRRLMRCLRTSAETAMDPRLIEILYRLSVRTKQRIQIVSGFRAPMFSTADLSYHTRGMAADIRIPGLTPLMVRDLALSLGVTGVGYYPVSQFVHVDVRDSRFTWTDYGKDRDDGEGREHGPRADPDPGSLAPL